MGIFACRRLSLLPLLAVALGTVGAVPAAATQRTATCGTLQSVLDLSMPGDVITLDGVCGDDESAPQFIIFERSLTLRGDASDGVDGFTGGIETPQLTVEAMGAAIDVHLEDLEFRNATGSALSVTGCSDVTVEDVVFIGNDSMASGGAIHATPHCGTGHADLTVTRGRFGGPMPGDGNTAGHNGGAIFLEGAANALHVTGAMFVGNSAGRDGGAIAVASVEDQPTATLEGVTIDASTFSSNTAGRSVGGANTAGGGAVLITGSAGTDNAATIHLTDNMFAGNRVDDDDGTTGAQEGGAVLIQRLNPAGATQQQALLERNDFVGNVLAEGGAGGALSVRGWRLDSLRDLFGANTIAGGTGARGGAVHVGPSTTASPTGAMANVYDAIFVGNAVPAGDGLGAALAATGTPTEPGIVTVRQSTFTGNLGPEAALAAGTDTTATVENSVVHATGATADAGETTGAVTVTTSNVCGAAGAPVAGVGNTCVAPRLTADGHQTATSPGLDGGTLAGATLFANMPGPARDHDGVTRVIGDLPDLGADEVSSADLGVTLDAQPAATTTGGAITYVGRIENAGSDLATNAVATLDLPAGTAPTAVMSSRGSCTVDGSRVVCAIGTLARFASATVSAQIAPAPAGRHESTLTAASDNPDPTPALVRAAATATDPPPILPPVDNLGSPPPVVTPPVVTPPLAKLKLADVLSLPATSRCLASRRLRITLRVPKGATLKTVVVRIGTARAKTYRAAALKGRRIDLKALPKGRIRVRITVTLADGRTFTATRTYRSCAVPKKR